MTKYKVGEVYGNRIYKGLNKNKSYTMECIFCGTVTNQHMKQSLNTICLCKREDTKYKIGSVINNRMVVGRQRPAGVIVKCKDCGSVSLLNYSNITTVLCSCKRDDYPRKKLFYLGKTLYEWSKMLGIPKNTFHTRIARGLSLNKSLGFGLGKVNYDCSGNPICEICGLSFKKLGNHTRMTHKILSDDYKVMFGLDKNQSLMCQSSIELARQRNLENYDTVVKENLILKGSSTRFKDGDEGRTKDKCSIQTLKRLSKLYTYNKK